MTSVEGSASGSVSTEERYKLIRSADVGAAAAAVAPATDYLGPISYCSRQTDPSLH